MFPLRVLNPLKLSGPTATDMTKLTHTAREDKFPYLKKKEERIKIKKNLRTKIYKRND